MYLLFIKQVEHLDMVGSPRIVNIGVPCVSFVGAIKLKVPKRGVKHHKFNKHAGSACQSGVSHLWEGLGDRERHLEDK